MSENESLVMRQRRVPPSQPHPDVSYADLARHRAAAAEGPSWAKHINSIAHSLLWIAAASYTWYRADVLTTVSSKDPRLSFPALYLAVAAIIVVFACYAYFAIAVAPGMKAAGAVDSDFEKYAPKTIQTATAASVIAFISFTVAAWGVWRYASILIVSVTFIAATLSFNLIPI